MAPFQWSDLIFYLKRNSPQVFGFDSLMWRNCCASNYGFYKASKDLQRELPELIVSLIGNTTQYIK